MSATGDAGAPWNPQTGFDGAMGFRITKATRDEVVAEYEIGAHHLQPYGIVHGGVHCGIVEAVCSTGAAMDALPRGQSVVGLENHTSFVRAVRQGRISVVARPLSRGRRAQLWEAVCRDEEGRIVSTGRVRLICLDAGSRLAGEDVRVKTPR
jgi:uncharacterized protein (TIGR00369 family)